MTQRIIYLHGFASGPSSKKAQFFRERLAELGLELGVPVLAEGDFERLTITAQLDVVERLAHGGPVSLIGSSMGGYLAALYAARHPEVEKVVLLAPAFGFARRWSESLGTEKLEEWKRTGWLGVYHYAEQRERRVGHQLISDGLGYEDYPEVSQPTLVFHGDKDAVVPAACSVQFAAGRPNVQFQLLDSDHELADVLEQMWEGVRRFLL
jgi:pimeloyl-ACP methyl ester carboxylesterase